MVLLGSLFIFAKYIKCNMHGAASDGKGFQWTPEHLGKLMGVSWGQSTLCRRDAGCPKMYDRSFF